MVGAGIAIFIQNNLVHQLRYMLHNICSKNQTEELAIIKPIERIEKSHINDNIPRTLTVHTDSRITLKSLTKQKNHNYIIEENRMKAITLEKLDNHFQLDEGSRRELRERASRQASERNRQKPRYTPSTEFLKVK